MLQRDGADCFRVIFLADSNTAALMSVNEGNADQVCNFVKGTKVFLGFIFKKYVILHIECFRTIAFCDFNLLFVV